jgi:Cu/Ag efflux pump CusA
LLTSITTIAGLSPIMFEQSFQAQILVPMAVSLSFGLMTATLLVVILVPSFYRIYLDVISLDSGPDQAPQTSVSAPAKELST